MGIVESYFEESSDFSKHVESIKGFDESVNYLNMFKESLDDDMTSILTAQQFQDITGQTIKKVISLVSEVETELLNLIKKFGMPVKAESTNTENTGELEASENKVETEQVWSGSEEKSGEQVSQSDVESLLNDFGF
jgi:chemotaxis protein CheZ